MQKEWVNKRKKNKRTEVFYKKVGLKNFAIFIGKHLCWSLFSIKLQTFRSATLLKVDSNTGVFLWILEFFLGRSQQLYQKVFNLIILIVWFFSNSGGSKNLLPENFTYFMKVCKKFFWFWLFPPISCVFQVSTGTRICSPGSKIEVIQYSHITNRNFKKKTNTKFLNPYSHSAFWKLTISQCSNFWRWVYRFVKINHFFNLNLSSHSCSQSY